MDWIPLSSEKQIEEIKVASETSKVAIFKHSTSCGISKMVLKGFEREVQSQVGVKTKFYFLDLLKFRAVSNAVASKLNVTHQSPQLIVLDKGAVIYADSHSNISAEACK